MSEELWREVLLRRGLTIPFSYFNYVGTRCASIKEGYKWIIWEWNF